MAEQGLVPPPWRNGRGKQSNPRVRDTVKECLRCRFVDFGGQPETFSSHKAPPVFFKHKRHVPVRATAGAASATYRSQTSGIL